jgi:NADH-quinone oxidoreductase subunit H
VSAAGASLLAAPAHSVLSLLGTTTSGDPLYDHGVGWFVWVVVAIKVLVAFAVLLVSVMLMIWFERKVISDMQSRIGPNRAGPWGLLQTLADGTKLFFKEDLLPDRADASVFRLAPYLSLIPALLIFTVIPVGGIITVSGHTFELQLADPPVGILLVLAMSSIAVYGVMLAGWSSGSKYPLLGAVRASAQMISYEAALGMTVVTVVLITGSLSTRAIVESQNGGVWDWNLIRLGVVPFILFMVSITAELTRPPFDLTEADSELVGGFNTEYSSIRFAMFFLAEFMNTVTMSAVVVTLFLGGPNGPIPRFIPTSDVWMPIIWFLAKTVVFLFVYVWLRAALPRLRYDQLMDLGWKRLIPLTLGWLLIVAAVVVWHWWGLLGILVVLVAGAILKQAFRVGANRTEDGALGPTMGAKVTPSTLFAPAVSSPPGSSTRSPSPSSPSSLAPSTMAPGPSPSPGGAH